MILDYFYTLIFKKIIHATVVTNVPAGDDMD